MLVSPKGFKVESVSVPFAFFQLSLGFSLFFAIRTRAGRFKYTS